MKTTNVCILGGTGFVGRHLAVRLAAEGINCQIPSRHPQRNRALQTDSRIRLLKTDLFDQFQLETALNGCDAAINLVGILNEGSGGQVFPRIHVELGNRLLEACKSTGVGRLLHMSALNANETNGPSEYLKSKGEAENRTLTLGQPQLRVTSFRPSVIFGRGDSFFNRFASLIKLPGPFPLACPDARFAPVYVGDVVEAMIRSLDDKGTWGRHYPLCGPRTFTLKQLVEYTASQLGRRKRINALGDRASQLQARVLGKLPGKPFSYDNYLSLQVDSVCDTDGLGKLGIAATDIDNVVPYYLSGKGEKNRYQLLRRLV